MYKSEYDLDSHVENGHTYTSQPVSSKDESKSGLKKVQSGLKKIRRKSVKVLKKVGDKIKNQIRESKKRRCVPR